MTDKKTTNNSSGKRVLIITERFYPEEFIVNDLVDDLRIQGLDFDILTQAPSYPYGKVSAYPGYKNRLLSVDYWKEIKTYRIKTIQGYRESKSSKIINYLFFALFSSIVLLFIGRKYKKIFVFHSGPLTVATAAIIGKRIFKTTNTIWSVDLWPDTVYMYGFKKSKWNKTLLDMFVKTIYKQFDTIYCSSPAFASRLKAYVGSKQIQTLLQWPQVEQNETITGGIELDDDSFNFTFTGNIAWTQNLGNVILGFSLAQKNYPKMKLNIFGDGSDLERLKNLTRDQGIENVVFWGRKPLKEMPSVYNQSNVLVISLQPDPVYDHYIPLKFSTYLAFKKPIFSVMNGVVKDLVIKWSLGIHAEPDNPHAIAEGFQILAGSSNEEREKMSINTEKLLISDFDRTKNVDRIIKTLSE